VENGPQKAIAKFEWNHAEALPTQTVILANCLTGAIRCFRKLARQYVVAPVRDFSKGIGDRTEFLHRHSSSEVAVPLRGVAVQRVADSYSIPMIAESHVCG
jgi:hypothetical protein